MHTTKITQILALAGFFPAGKLSQAYSRLLPVFKLFVATLGKPNWRRAYAVFVLCAGTVIALPAQIFTTLHRFDGTNGLNPYAGLVQATNGELYGTASLGGAQNGGTVFKITPSGALTTLYSFCSQSGCTDGQYPDAGLVQATNGDLYGTTAQGGAKDAGTVFRITPSGALTTLYSFCSQSGCTDGQLPEAGLIQAANGDFYGTTYGCGISCVASTIFKITPSGVLTTLHSFSFNGIDGSNPVAGLVQATNGDVYGTMSLGGANGAGTVFKITPGGTLRVLYSFCAQSGCPDGQGPNGLVQATNGDLYGTTYSGGTNCIGGCGTVFKITPTNTLTTLHSFAGDLSEGSYPVGGLVQATNGDLYGTTVFGGVAGSGTVFEITPGGTLTTLYGFCHQSGCPDGSNPRAELVQDTDGILYGTTVMGGACSITSVGCGTVFSLTAVGLGPFVETQTTSGKVGAAVKILGTDLTGSISVSFNGTAAVFEVVSSSLITTIVPAGATSGEVQVVTALGPLSSSVPFRVLP